MNTQTKQRRAFLVRFYRRREYSRHGIIAFVPRGGRLVAFQGRVHIVQLCLVYFRHGLIVGGCSSEIALDAVSIHSDLEASDGVAGGILAVGLEGVDEGVGGIVKFV